MGGNFTGLPGSLVECGHALASPGVLAVSPIRPLPDLWFPPVFPRELLPVPVPVAVDHRLTSEAEMQKTDFSGMD